MPPERLPAHRPNLAHIHGTLTANKQFQGVDSNHHSRIQSPLSCL